MSNELRTAGLCIDLDGAVVTTPLLAMIASEVDMVDEVNLLDRAAEHGELSFARAHRLQMLALSAVPLAEAQRRVRVAGLDDEVAELVVAARDRVRVVTSLPQRWVEPLADRLGCEVLGSLTPDQEQADSVVTILDKGRATAELRAEYATIVAVTSSTSGLSMFESADVSVAFGLQPSPEAVLAADYVAPTGAALWNLLQRQ